MFFAISANEDTPQLYSACGRGPRSTLRVLRHGLEVTEMAVSELPGNPNAVWTVKKRADGKYSIPCTRCYIRAKSIFYKITRYILSVSHI